MVYLPADMLVVFGPIMLFLWRDKRSDYDENIFIGDQSFSRIEFVTMLNAAC